jgi:polygalacturonase
MISILSFGARVDVSEPQHAAIQAAIDTCAEAGGGTVLVPAGRYVTGTLQLRSAVTLHLDNGSRLVGSKHLEDYPEVAAGFTDAVGQRRNRCLLYANGCTSIAVTGQGVIDGSGAAFARDLQDRPFMLRFIDCTGVQLNGVSLVDSPGWVCHLLGCENVLLHGLTIRSHVNSNNDGIDLDSCRRVRVAQCDVDTGDDAICLKATRATPCENITITGCVLRSDWAALKLGTESVGDFRNIVISDIVIRDTHGGGLKLISMDGSRVENVMVDNLVMDNVSGPIFIRLGARLRKYHADQPNRPVGVLRRVSIRRVVGRVWEKGERLYGVHERRAGIIVTGIPGHPVEDLSFEDVQLTFPGGGTEADAARHDVPEQAMEYPEFPVFHPIPAWGFYLRHARGVRLRDIRLRTESPDARPALATTDVEGLETENFP